MLAIGHDGIVVADGDLAEGDFDVRPPSAGVAAVQQIGLTTWDQATLLKRVWGFDALTCTGCGGARWWRNARAAAGRGARREGRGGARSRRAWITCRREHRHAGAHRRVVRGGPVPALGVNPREAL
jgi:hypothetical protein